MENEQDFKKLLQSDVEQASPDFTGLVMGGIKKETAPAYIDARWKKWFSIVFMAVSILVVGLSFLSGPVQQFVSAYVKVPDIPSTTILYVVSYIFSFWVLIAISFKVDKLHNV